MKNILLLILGMTIGVNAFCQAGIDTLSPQQMLHVNGAPSTSTAVGTTGKFLVTPTVRVGGLNQTNNPAQPASPAISTLPLYATVSGDLVIGSRGQRVVQSLAGANAIPVDSITVPSGTAGITVTLYTVTFTLNQPALVYFAADVAFAFTTSPSSSASITDGQAKSAGLEFTFSSVPAGSGIPTGSYFAAVIQPFMQSGFNGTNPFGPTGVVPDGNLTYNLDKVLKLPTGSYTFSVIAYGSAGSGTAFELHYGLGTNNHINITGISL